MTSVLFRTIDKKHKALLLQLGKEWRIQTRNKVLIRMLDNYAKDRERAVLVQKQHNQLMEHLAELQHHQQSAERHAADAAKERSKLASLVKGSKLASRQYTID